MQHESGKNGPRGKNPREKMVPGKLVPEKMVPENSETKNRGVSVEHRGVCVCVCVCVCGMLGCDQSMKTTNPKLGNKKSWGR